MKKLEKKLTCPCCGCTHAITLHQKIWLMGKGLERCRVCGCLLAHPWWFDFLSIVILTFLAYQLTLHVPFFANFYNKHPLALGTRDNIHNTMLLFALPYIYLRGLFGQYFIALYPYNSVKTIRFRGKIKTLMPKLACPRCGCPDAIDICAKRVLFGERSDPRCRFCGCLLTGQWWFEVGSLFGLIGIVPLEFYFMEFLKVQAGFAALQNGFYKNLIFWLTLYLYVQIMASIRLYFVPNRVG